MGDAQMNKFLKFNCKVLPKLKILARLMGIISYSKCWREFMNLNRSVSFLRFFSLVLLTLASFSTLAQQQNPKEYLPYYGKILNNMIRTQSNLNPIARVRFIKNINPEVLRDELFRVLTLNHIEKADQGFDAIVNDCGSNSQQNCYKHDKNDYTYSRSIVYNELDKQTATQISGADFVVDVYCQQVFKFSGNRSSKSKKHSAGGGFQNSRTVSHSVVNYSTNLVQSIQPNGDINIEHTWPQSRFTNQYSKELQKGDLHHLFPSNGTINGIRSSYPFGEVERENDSIANCPSVLGFDRDGRQVFEPVDGHKGNVARALFYFSVRYEIAISPSEEVALKAWHQLDPVDDAERERNNRIFSIQKNRNPFIDFPELVASFRDF